MKLKVDKFTIDEANDYADRQGMIEGFSRGSNEWHRAFNHQLKKAVGTMSLGRNPFRANPRDDSNWPEVFGDKGFAGIVARNYRGKAGEKVSKREIGERIKASVSALVYLYLNGILEIKTTTTTSQSGEINTSEMSDLQLSEAGSDVRNHDVAMNQLMLTIVETICYESLIPFFTLKPQDVVDIKDKARITGKISVKAMAEKRSEIEKELRSRIGSKLKKTDFGKLILED